MTRSLGLSVFDDVMPDPHAYRWAALDRPFHSFDLGGHTFRGIGLTDDLSLPKWIAGRFPSFQPSLSFFRQSPAGQVEPNYVHDDSDMGHWTAILYLNPEPAKGDGTNFYRHVPTGAIARQPGDAAAADWSQRDRWELRDTVAAKFNRLIVFPSAWFHSRAIADNYGAGDEARLIQVVFGDVTK